MQLRKLYPTKWLAAKLNLSIAAIERLRAQGSTEIPPHVVIGNGTIRYADLDVEQWLESRLQPKPVSTTPPPEPEAGDE